ncbi:hypothetical protein H1R20_g13698, partial [Candolleomyces eurysporus]
MESAISFSSEELYIGYQVKERLVQKAKDSIAISLAQTSPVIRRPTFPDTTVYEVEILQPAPSPFPAPSNPTLKVNSPQANTPRSEPTCTTRILTLFEQQVHWQVLEEAAAAASNPTSATWVRYDASPLLPDRTQLIFSVGSPSTSLSLLSIRKGLSEVLSSSYHLDVGVNQIGNKLIKHFAAISLKSHKSF